MLMDESGPWIVSARIQRKSGVSNIKSRFGPFLIRDSAEQCVVALAARENCLRAVVLKAKGDTTDEVEGEVT